jgi:hypothetical protein
MISKDVSTTERLTDRQEQQRILSDWVAACETALKDCPASFLPQFTELMFLGQRLITEARVIAQMNTPRDANHGML